jgi:DNA repair protein RecO (recombination protein O)
MKFRDEGIIISTKKYGENSLILKIFSREHGIYRSFVRYAKSSKAKAIYQVGNLVSFEFIARIEDSLGSFTNLDLVTGYCGKIIFEKTKLDCAKSLFSMIDAFFLEREEQKSLFLEVENFLEKISNDNISDPEIIANYIRLELSILEALGYAIDLSCCVVTSANVDLAFVSPKSGRAVSLEAGKPYENKLLKLPNFLTENNIHVNETHLVDGLKLSGFFLERFLTTENRKHQFEGRNNLLKSLEK